VKIWNLSISHGMSVVVPFIPSLAVATSPKALAWIWQEEHETVSLQMGFIIK
jgi:hypothetical protein